MALGWKIWSRGFWWSLESDWDEGGWFQQDAEKKRRENDFDNEKIQEGFAEVEIWVWIGKGGGGESKEYDEWNWFKQWFNKFDWLSEQSFYTYLQ